MKINYPKHISTMYRFVRGRQLEGTFPGEPSTGIWPITGWRVGFGWGDLPEEAWPTSRGQWPPIEPPDADAQAKRYRTGRYQRVRSLDECKRVLGGDRPLPILVSLDITEKWWDAPNGRVPAPDPHDVVVGNHCVLLVGYDDSSAEFTFQNSWGANWGDQGFGYIDYKMFEETWWEGWLSDYVGGRDDTPKEPAGFRQGSWGLQEHGGGIFHCREFNNSSDERIGWTFAIERAEGVEVEELFVRPAFRRQGHGRRLIRLVNDLAVSKGLSLKIWIPDSDAELSNLGILRKLFDPLGLQIVDSGVRWVPLVAASRTQPLVARAPTMPRPSRLTVLSFG